MHTPTSSVRRAIAALLIAGASLVAVQAGCGDSGDTSTFPGQTGEDGGDLTVTPPFPEAPDGGQSASDADPDALGTLVDQDLVGCVGARPALVFVGTLDLDNYSVRMRGLRAEDSALVFDSCDVPLDHFGPQTGAAGLAPVLGNPPVCN